MLDINECLTIAPNCSHNAQCVDTLGSYQCQCTNGYAGDGYDCTGKVLGYYHTTFIQLQAQLWSVIIIIYAHLLRTLLRMWHASLRPFQCRANLSGEPGLSLGCCSSDIWLPLNILSR